jgi:hypothetical protein
MLVHGRRLSAPHRTRNVLFATLVLGPMSWKRLLRVNVFSAMQVRGQVFLELRLPLNAIFVTLALGPRLLGQR